MVLYLCTWLLLVGDGSTSRLASRLNGTCQWPKCNPASMSGKHTNQRHHMGRTFPSSLFEIHTVHQFWMLQGLWRKFELKLVKWSKWSKTTSVVHSLSAYTLWASEHLMQSVLQRSSITIDRKFSHTRSLIVIQTSVVCLVTATQKAKPCYNEAVTCKYCL